MRFRRLVVCAAVLLATVPLAVSELMAQDGAERHREGIWYGLGAGAGWDRLACDICAGDRIGGLSGYLQAGGTLQSDWLLGAELKFWNKGDESVDQLLGAFSIVALWYPNPARPFHVKGGFGYMALHAEDGENTLSSTSFGPQVGVGYDLPIGPRVFVTPYASWMITPFGDLTFNDTKIRGGVRSTLLQLGIGVTHH